MQLLKAKNTEWLKTCWYRVSFFPCLHLFCFSPFGHSPRSFWQAIWWLHSCSRAIPIFALLFSMMMCTLPTYLSLRQVVLWDGESSIQDVSKSCGVLNQEYLCKPILFRCCRMLKAYLVALHLTAFWYFLVRFKDNSFFYFFLESEMPGAVLFFFSKFIT